MQRSGFPGNRWVILAAVALLAGLRWLLMSSPAHFTPWLPAHWFRGDALGVTRLGANVFCCAVLLVAFPALMVVLVRRRHLVPTGAREHRPPALASMGSLFGVGRPQLGSGWLSVGVGLLWIGAVLVGLGATYWLAPLREAYPIVRAAGRDPQMLIVSSLLTGILLLTTELFYRGIALSVAYEKTGVAAVYLLAPIYALDHVGAPAAEAVASAFAAILLAHLALATRSIWHGFVAHLLCALSVDWSSLWLSGRFWFQPGRELASSLSLG
jgi:hypothetical protein